jgi:hypothetical protein
MEHEQKVCTCCKVPKPIDEFPLRSKKNGRRRGRCRSCIYKAKAAGKENDGVVEWKLKEGEDIWKCISSPLNTPL